MRLHSFSRLHPRGDPATRLEAMPAPPRAAAVAHLAGRLLPLAFAALAASVVAYCTAVSIGVSPDSVSYLDGARHLRAGQGFVTAQWGGLDPITHWPPFYPAAVAGVMWLTRLDTLATARLLGVTLAAVTVLLLCGALRWAGKGTGAAVFGAAFVLSSSPLLELHAMAWSEPLFLALTLAAILLLARYLAEGRRAALTGAAVAVGLACLTRYPGVALAATGAVALVVAGGRPLRRRVSDLLLFGVLAGAPLLLWILRNRLAAGSATDRGIAFHPPSAGALALGARTLGGWLLPAAVAPALTWPAAGAVLALLVVAWVVAGRDDTAPDDAAAAPRVRRDVALGRLLVGFTAIYFGFLLFSIAFFDGGTPLDERILAPAYLCTVAALALVLPEGGRARLAAAAVALAVLVPHALDAAAWVGDTHDDGLGYTSRSWRERPLWTSIRALPPDAAIYSNLPAAVWFTSGRDTEQIPAPNPANLHSPAGLPPALLPMAATLRATHGAIVYFVDEAGAAWLPTPEELRSALGASVSWHDDEALLLTMPAGGGASRR